MNFAFRAEFDLKTKIIPDPSKHSFSVTLLKTAKGFNQRTC